MIHISRVPWSTIFTTTAHTEKCSIPRRVRRLQGGRQTHKPMILNINTHRGWKYTNKHDNMRWNYDNNQHHRIRRPGHLYTGEVLWAFSASRGSWIWSPDPAVPVPLPLVWLSHIWPLIRLLSCFSGSVLDVDPLQPGWTRRTLRFMISVNGADFIKDYVWPGFHSVCWCNYGLV